MFKKLIFIIPVAVFTLISMPASVHACDYTCPEEQETCANPCDGESTDLITGEIAEPIGDTAEILTTVETGDTATDTTQEDNTPVVAEDAENTETSTEENPLAPVVAQIEQFAEEKFGFTLNSETWPLVLSASALILTVILIIIINLIAHHKARKATAKANRQELADGLLDL